ncbi:MAG: ROK family protein [Nevskiales bacterium]
MQQAKQEILRLGVDLGGTKIEAAVVAGNGEIVSRQRRPTPQGDYTATLQTIAELVTSLEAESGQGALPTGICTPGAISPASGLVKNANSTCLNGKPLKQDLQAMLERELRLANDADCLAVSEAVDGAAAGAQSVFAVILGTGVGGGLVYEGKLLSGPHAITGEWGHNPLPWVKMDWQEVPGPVCWCGQHGCIETWLSGPGLARDYGELSTPGEVIVQRAEAGEANAKAALARYEDRLARSLAHVINLFDPEVIVLGGGLSNIRRIYKTVPALWDAWVFSDVVNARLLPARHGDASGVRGAAWLW